MTVLRVKRILQEIVIKRRRDEQLITDEVQALWVKAQRKAVSENQAACLCRVREGGPVPKTNELEWSVKVLGDFVSKRGMELRRSRMRRYDALRAQKLKDNPSKAFECVKPDPEPHLAVIKRRDGTLTANVVEMDNMLRENWCNIFGKHDENNPPPDVSVYYWVC